MVTERALNESPSEKEGKCLSQSIQCRDGLALNESPSEKEGKSAADLKRGPGA